MIRHGDHLQILWKQEILYTQATPHMKRLIHLLAQLFFHLTPLMPRVKRHLIHTKITETIEPKVAERGVGKAAHAAK